MIALVFLSLLGCASKHMTIQKADLTGSPCRDGVITNMKAAGCIDISEIEIPGKNAVRIKCSSEHKSEVEWLKFTFYFSQDPGEIYRDGMMPICADPAYYGFWIETYVEPPVDDSKK